MPGGSKYPILKALGPTKRHSGYGLFQPETSNIGTWVIRDGLILFLMKVTTVTETITMSMVPDLLSLAPQRAYYFGTGALKGPLRAYYLGTWGARVLRSMDDNQNTQ